MFAPALTLVDVEDVPRVAAPARRPGGIDRRPATPARSTVHRGIRPRAQFGLTHQDHSHRVTNLLPVPVMGYRTEPEFYTQTQRWTCSFAPWRGLQRRRGEPELPVGQRERAIKDVLLEGCSRDDEAHEFCLKKAH